MSLPTHIETEETARLTVDLHDVGGRLLAQVLNGVVEAGEREILLPEGVQGAALVVVRDEEGRSVGKVIGQ